MDDRSPDRSNDDLLLLAIICVVIAYYYDDDNDYDNDVEHSITKKPCKSSGQTGSKFVMEILQGHPVQCHESFTMDKYVFRTLCIQLRDKYMLRGSRNIQIPEMVAMFLMTLGHAFGNRMVKEQFAHSGETVSRLFNKVLDSVCLLAGDIIKPIENHLLEVPANIRNDNKYWPYFRNCIGAIVGIHIPAVVENDKILPFIGRKGVPTQNVMAVCDFDMLYTFVCAGWEGSTLGTRIFDEVVKNDRMNFPKPPLGKYYLVDAGYPNKIGYLAPYKGERYHLPEFQCGSPASGPRELFNQAHSSLRSVIERAFSVTKKKWPILKMMHSYPFKTQVKIVVACMALHNFVRLNCRNDEDFVFDANEDMEGTEDAVHGDPENLMQDDNEMSQVRDFIASEIYATGH